MQAATPPLAPIPLVGVNLALTWLSVPADEEGPEGLTQFLMTEVRRLRDARKSQLQREQQLQARGRALEEERAGLEQRLREQQQAQERCQRLREDWEAGSLELLRLKDENYMIAMRLAQLSEEKNSAVLRSRDLQLAVGPGTASLVGLGGEEEWPWPTSHLVAGSRHVL